MRREGRGTGSDRTVTGQRPDGTTGATGRVVRAGRRALGSLVGRGRSLTSGSREGPEVEPPPDTSSASTMFAYARHRGFGGRPQYLWPILAGARQARALGHRRISAIEFGVAGGNGLVAMEALAALTESLTGVTVDVFGFDSGSGMPEPVDHRDVPWAIEPGWFAMDEAALRARLTTAELVLGPVEDTVPRWLASAAPPIGFIAFDLDYYSSTVHAFRALEAEPARILPRIPCYFDDVLGYGWSDFNGERAAIADFNRDHDQRKIGQIYGLRYELPAADATAAWPEKLFLAHAFDHPSYNTPEGGLSPGWFEALRLQDPDPG